MVGSFAGVIVGAMVGIVALRARFQNAQQPLDRTDEA